VSASDLAPLTLREDGAGRRWLAGRSMRGPLVALKFMAPLLVLGGVAALVAQKEEVGRMSDLTLVAFALLFAIPFVLAALYPVLRWLPQEWTIDADGVRGRGRVNRCWRWSEVGSWGSAAIDRLPAVVYVELRRATGRSLARLVIAERERSAVEAWLRAAAPNAERRDLMLR